MGKFPRFTINLLKQEKNYFNHFLNWALSIGRVIIIIVEFIALSAFFYRIVLDTQISELRDKLTVKEDRLKSLNKDEEKYRQLQARLAVIKGLKNQGEQTVNVFNSIFNPVPQNFIVTNVSLSPDSVKIEAQTTSVDALVEYITGIQGYDFVSSVSIDRIENKTASAVITVGITLLLQNKTQ